MYLYPKSIEGKIHPFLRHINFPVFKDYVSPINRPRSFHYAVSIFFISEFTEENIQFEESKCNYIFLIPQAHDFILDKFEVRWFGGYDFGNQTVISLVNLFYWGWSQVEEFLP